MKSDLGTILLHMLGGYAVYIFLLWFWNKKAIERSKRKGLTERSTEERIISALCFISFFPFVWSDNRGDHDEGRKAIGLIVFIVLMAILVGFLCTADFTSMSLISLQEQSVPVSEGTLRGSELPSDPVSK